MVKEMLGHSDVQLTMRVYAHIFEADREKVAANVNRAVNEVHEMCTEPLETEIMSRSKAPKDPSDLRFFLKTGNQVDSGTWDYESAALLRAAPTRRQFIPDFMRESDSSNDLKPKGNSHVYALCIQFQFL